ncbi:MAG TPA: alpha-amylase family glycosyl hydrolase [Phnomibacter sp.]|nr:alpha-amylase family glycosyl hydrolase [Phnomibacter sp.]
MIQPLYTPVGWCHHTNIYEVNLRQYTYEGTFDAFAEHLPRLQAMGVETLWFMPITPIGVPERLGTLGSYYACSSYVNTNPEFGTIDDFKRLVETAHSMGMKVIIDWVANHTGYGHDWMQGRKRDYYAKSPSGNFTERNGWRDVADLDYNNNDMRKEMIESMQFWIKTCDIDGFRCDMAHLVPLDFWMEARAQCDAVKHLFWLAETEDLFYHQVFDATYAWAWMHATEAFVKAKSTLTVLDKVLYDYRDAYPAGSFKLIFTSNHDENSWNGTEIEKYGQAALPFAVFSATFAGIPLLYSGQELPNTKRLKFFEKDEIEWTENLQYESFYKALLELRKRNAAAGGPLGAATLMHIPARHENLMVYLRRQGDQEVLVALNFSDQHLEFHVNDERVQGLFHEIFTNKFMNFELGRKLEVEPYGYLVMEKG